MAVRCKKCGHIEEHLIVRPGIGEDVVIVHGYEDTPLYLRCPECNGEWENV